MFDCPRCGRYQIDPLAGKEIATLFANDRYLISAATRRASARSATVVVDHDTIPKLIASVHRPGTFSEMVDRTVLLYAERSPSFHEASDVSPQLDYPLIVAKDAKEFQYFLTTGAERGWFTLGPSGLAFLSRLSPAGWDRADELQLSRPQSRQAFVAMWFDPAMDALYTDGFKPGVENDGRFDAVRVDQLAHNGKIDDRIVAEIRRSGLVVADFTGHRGGVYFEAGLAMGLGIPVIWTCRKDNIKDAHFDTRQYNHIAWESAADLRDKLAARIAATILTITR
jgi:hypothetical protein